MATQSSLLAGYQLFSPMVVKLCETQITKSSPVIRSARKKKKTKKPNPLSLFNSIHSTSNMTPSEAEEEEKGIKDWTKTRKWFLVFCLAHDFGIWERKNKKEKNVWFVNHMLGGEVKDTIVIGGRLM